MPDETSPKDLIRVIKGNKGLTIVAIGAAILLLFYLYKQSQAVGATSGASTAAALAPTGFAPALGTYTYVEDIHQGATPVVGPAGPAGATGTQGPTGPTGPAAKPPVVKKTPAPPKVKPPVKSPAVSSQGLLGAGIKFFPNYKSGLAYYRGPHTSGKIIAVPLPKNTTYQPGPNGRIWYQSPPGSAGKLLTIGNG
jgi:collagen type I alpha